MITSDIKRQIEEIIAVLQKVSLGDFSVRLQLPEKEEVFTELIAGINLMIEDLQEHEKEKKEKIAELERFNRLTVDRELKMIGLKKEIEELKKKLP